MNKKPVLISGIQPSGKLHLGNYLGALKNFTELQDSGDYRCLFFVADLHSINEDFDPKEKAGSTEEVVLDYLAAGIDPGKSTIFVQSAVPAHSELAILLANFTPFGELNRMTQFKEKSQNQPHNVNAGLFNYPVLMAADILLYDAKFVPVGDDQLQHLEFTRFLARRFNSRFGKVLIEPKPLITRIPRLMSLDDPYKKMSKSLPAGCLFLSDSPKEIRSKLARAVTDSGKEIRYNEKKKPGMSNLLLIYSALDNRPIETLEKMYQGKGYAEFKKDLAEVIINRLGLFQERRKGLKKDREIFRKITADGAKEAGKFANKKVAEIKKKIGLKVV